MQDFAIVAAIDQERGIGRAGGIAWRLKADLKYFRELTIIGPEMNTVIMGRKTWQSIPEKFRPLPGRINIVISRSTQFSGTTPAANLNEAIELPANRVFVIGGGEIYAQAIEHPQCSELFLTRVSGSYACDTFFPPYEHLFQVDSVLRTGSEDGIDYRMERWVRKDAIKRRFDLSDAG